MVPVSVVPVSVVPVSGTRICGACLLLKVQLQILLWDLLQALLLVPLPVLLASPNQRLGLSL